MKKAVQKKAVKLTLGSAIQINTKTGELLAVYLRFRGGKSARTVEYADGAVFADFNRQGELLGIEVLSPCSVKVLEGIARGEPVQARRFVRSAVPRQMVAVA
jgi:hypothetical protein